MGKSFSELLALVMILVVLVLDNSRTESARILCLSHQSGSHMLMTHAIGQALLDDGHEVYTVFSDKMKVPKDLEEKQFKILKFHTPDDSFIMHSKKEEKAIINKIFHGLKADESRASMIAGCECRDMDNDKALEQQINDLKFDLLVVDIFPLSSCFTFVSLKHSIPFVTSSPVLDLEVMRTMALPSFIPFALMQSSDEMTFIERLWNVMFTVMTSVPALGPFPAMKDTRLIEKYSKDPKITTWLELNRKAELFLVSRGFVLEYPSPLMPNVINIECLTCDSGEPLDKEVSTLIDRYNAIIVVSFGSEIAKLPDHVTEKFFRVFAQRKEVIFWRYEGKTNVNIPDNVKLMKWLPQNDLLAHPKTKLFITHSGNNGQYESIYHGVPMLAFPLFAEQPHNSFRIVRHGYGLASDITKFTVEGLLRQIEELIDTPVFREKTRKASRILKSAPMDARETAAYWIDHILEFGGSHLQSHALDMPWYSVYMIDIFLFVQLVLLIGLAVLVGICSALVKCMCPSTKKVKIN